MKLITTILVFSIAIIIPYLDQTNYPIFLYISGYTIYIEILLFIWIMRYRTLKRIKESNLTIGFKQIINTINQSTNFQSYIPDDSDRLNNSSLSFSPYEPSQLEEQIEMDEVEEIQQQQLGQKSRIQQQADMYLNQLKNYFGSQKLPLIKLDRKITLQKYQSVINLTDSLLSYYSNMDKIIDSQNQASLLSKLSKKEIISIIDQVDSKEKHIFIMGTIEEEEQLKCFKQLFQIQQLQNKSLRLPNWSAIKIQIKSIHIIFQQQRYQLLKISQPQIQSLQKAYLEEYKNIKKIKNQTQQHYDDVFRKHQKLEGEKSLLEKDLEYANIQYKDLKKNKGDPERLIRMEMSLKLYTQQLSTVQHKLQNSKGEMKELEIAIKKTNEQLNEFKDNWERQFTVMYQTIVRAVLQNHYDNYLQFFQSFKTLIKFQNNLSEDKSLNQSQVTTPTELILRQQRTVSTDELDPTRLMRNEKEQLQEFIKKFKELEDQINSYEKYDSDCLDYFVELTEQIRKISIDEIKIFIPTLKQNWITESFAKGFPQNNKFYQNLYQNLKDITNNFIENRSKLYKEYKNTQVSVKERLNNITYLFNCILKDSEKFNPTKIDGFTNYQNQKQSFQQNYFQYQNETTQLKKKLNSYEVKYKLYIKQHQESISATKFHFMNSFIILAKEVSKFTLRMIDEIDDQYEKQDQIVKTLIARQESICFTNEIGLKKAMTIHNNTTTLPKTSSRSNSQNARQQGDSINSLKETFVLRQLVRVLFLQWTKSLFFKQKFMTELYRSLNKKRPSQLDEIFVTNIDIGGEPPEVLQFIPQKSTNSCIFDLELSFRGYFYLELETFVNISWAKKNLPVNIKVKITTLNGRLRLCYTPNFIGKSWISFVGEPQMNISIEPTISKYNISVANDIIKEFLIYKIKMLTYPNKESITVPLAEFEAEIPKSALEKIQSFVNKIKNQN